jgi:hypothetical protein
MSMEDGKKIFQLNGYKSEMVFEKRWPIIRKKKKHQYFLLAKGLIY